MISRGLPKSLSLIGAALGVLAVGACESGSPPDPIAAGSTPCRAVASGPDFVPVFAQVAPSVVGIVAGKRGEGARFEAERLGSGILWDEEGHIVTNDHLVGDAPEVRVRTHDGLIWPARIVGRAPRADLAVLAATPGKIQPAKRARSESVQVGMWVAAIGNPYGMEQSITVGVVSAVGRRNMPKGAPHYRNFIQTDASFNPGNSGGPLVDLQGRVVGVNTAMLGRGQGLSFAIPIDMVSKVVSDLLRHGRFIRGFAGLYPTTVSLKAATRAGLDRQRGARIRGMVQGGPADQAGLAPGDIILRYADTHVDEPSMLPWLIAATAPGTAVELRIARGEERLSLTMVVGGAPE